MSTITARRSVHSGTQSLERGLQMLKLVAANNSQGLRLVDIVRMTGTERPTAHRSIQALLGSRLIKRVENTKRYVLGDYCYELLAAVPDRNDLRAICMPALRSISKATGNSAFLAIRVEHDSLCIARTIGSYPIQVLSIRVGNRMPLGIGAGGLAILSDLDESERNQIIRVNDSRIRGFGGMNTTILKGLVHATRQRGHSVVGHYSVPGVVGLGVVLRNAESQVIGSITSASTDSRMTKQQQSQTVQCLEEAVAAIQPALDGLAPYMSSDTISFVDNSIHE